MARSSWRYEYSDHNKSFLIKEAETQFTAFWAIRAPKGEVAARYIAPDNADLIRAMFGYPSADYPDLYDLIEFNKHYGAYVSAAPGTSKDVPNYYGGVYNTAKGLLQMYCNTDKNSPNFQVSIKPAQYSEWVEQEDKVVEGETVTVPAHAKFVSEIASKLLLDTDIKFSTKLNFGNDQATVIISGIPASILPKMDAFIFDYWNSSKVTGFKYVIKEVTEDVGVFLPSDEEVADEEGRNIACGYYQLQEDGTFTFVLGGSNTLSLDYRWNTKADENRYGIPFIDYKNVKNNPIYDYENTLNLTAASTSEIEKLEKALLTGDSYVKEGSNKILKFSKAISDRFRILYNVEDITFSYVNQSSPTADLTKIQYSGFCYDKYKFDKLVPFTNKLPVTDQPVTEPAITGLFAHIEYHKTGSVVTLYEGTKEDGKYTFEEVTSDFETQKIALSEGKDLLEEEGFNAKEFVHNIYYVSDSGMVQMTEDGAYPLELNPDFNSYTIEGIETDENGEIVSTSPLSGSLDPKAETPNGQDFFFEDTFVPDQASIITQRVVQTFDKFLDAKGFYTGYRIKDGESKTVNGQRCLDYIVAEAKAEHADKPNSAFNQIGDASPKVQKKFAAAIKQSLIEAQKGKYEECFFFVDPSGIDSVKEYYSMIRTNHTMAEVISVKLINESLASKVSKVTVSGRIRGGIQICQEFLFKDSNKNKYYSSVIGAYAAMVMKTIETTRGGKQPCWINERDVGGQLDNYLTRTPISMRWDFTDVSNPQTGAKADTEILDLKGINPIILDPVDGVMVTSGVTTELNAGDWSRVGHTVSFDCCKREIRDNVMKPQVEKAIDDYYMDMRKEDTDKILKLRTDTYKIWSYAACKVHEVNTEYTKAQEIFNIDVEVRVKPTSRKVKLSFTNLGQITLVKD